MYICDGVRSVSRYYVHVDDFIVGITAAPGVHYFPVNLSAAVNLLYMVFQ